MPKQDTTMDGEKQEKYAESNTDIKYWGKLAELRKRDILLDVQINVSLRSIFMFRFILGRTWPGSQGPQRRFGGPF